MSSRYPTIKLRDLIKVHHGFAFKGEHFQDEESGLVVVTPGNFHIGGGFKSDKLKWYSPEGTIPEGYYLEPGTLIVTMTDLSKKADTLGFPAIIPDDELRYLHNQRIGVVEVLRPDLVEARYLYYAMITSEYRNRVVATASGSTVHHTSPSRIGEAEIPLPESKADQEKIADILGSLDDKIEANRAMNRTLEAMVQALYREWFVDLGPFQDEAFVDSELGEIPAGWRVGSLGDIATNARVRYDPAEHEVERPYIGLADMPRGSVTLTDWGSSRDATSGKWRFERGDLLFGKLRPYFKKVGVAPVNGICSTDILVVRPKEAPFYGQVMAQLLQDPFIDYNNASSGGTRMPRTSWKTMAKYKIAIPPPEVAEAFTALVRPWSETIIVNVHESRHSASVRDYLLPRLLAGEVKLERMEETAAFT